jgi:hypothetical protein
MKTMTIEVPREGACVELVFRGKVSPAQAVIVATDDVEIRYGNQGLGSGAAAPAAKLAAKPPLDLDAISFNLCKLGTKRRTAAVNVIRTMFQFTNPVTAETANRILEDLCRRGDLTITPGGAVEFTNQK